MTIYDLTIYVNQDADDTFSFQEVARWFNKAISNYNLIPPVTRYPFVTVDNYTTANDNEFLENGNFNEDAVFDLDNDDDEIGAGSDYPLPKTFMLGIILPFIVSSSKGAESSLQERQIYLQDFMMNARQFKAVSNIEHKFMFNRRNEDIGQYELGENVFISDMRYSPFSDNWGKSTIYYEIKDEEEE